MQRTKWCLPKHWLLRNHKALAKWKISFILYATSYGMIETSTRTYGVTSHKDADIMGRPDEKSENSHQRNWFGVKIRKDLINTGTWTKSKNVLSYLHSAPHLSQVPIVFLCPEILKYNKVSAMYIVGLRFTLCSEYIFGNHVYTE